MQFGILGPERTRVAPAVRRSIFQPAIFASRRLKDENPSTTNIIANYGEIHCRHDRDESVDVNWSTDIAVSQRFLIPRRVISVVGSWTRHASI